MKLKSYVIIAVLSGLVLLAGCAPQQNEKETKETEAVAQGFPELKGPYLGQTPPGDEAELFAPGIVTDQLMNRDVTISKDGKEIYFGVGVGRFAFIAYSQQVDGVWTEPAVASFAKDPQFAYFEPAFSHDDQRLYLLCNKAPEGEKQGRGWQNQHIWYAEREGKGEWSEIKPLGAPIYTEDFDYFPSVADNGTLYYTWSKKGARETYIYRARLVDGKYQEPEKLPEEVNAGGQIYNACIASDESYLLACVNGREDSLAPGMSNYYVFFRYEDDTWSEGISLGEKVNFPGVGAASLNISRDGKYLFFAANKFTKKMPEELDLNFLKEATKASMDIYWIDASFIEKLRPEK